MTKSVLEIQRICVSRMNDQVMNGVHMGRNILFRNNELLIFSEMFIIPIIINYQSN